jgi:predicted amidohydrolase YtcJ
MYAVGGVLSRERPAKVDSIVDLGGGYAIPPFAEAHNHNVHASEGLDSTISAYLRDGVFYIATLSNLPRLTQAIRPRINCPTSVDVIFAHGGITGTRGHPIRVRERLLQMGWYPGFTIETLRDHGYFVVDSLPDIERKLPILLADQPDIVKILLLFSEEYEKRKDDDRYFGLKGLDPRLIRPLVERVHRAGLRVFAHVETSFDFRVAVDAGVDVVAHLPGKAQPERIDSAAAIAAARKRISVITTASLVARQPLLGGGRERFDRTTLLRVRDAQRANLALLRWAGVDVIIGSDGVDDTSVGEVEYLRKLGPYSDADLLRMWTVRTPRVLFPSRRVGGFADGYEASFLVLDGNPLEDWNAIRRIRLRVKQGVTLRL